MAWWNHLVNSGPAPTRVRKTLNPPPTIPRPPPPASQEPPLLLTRDRAIRPTAAMWKRANALLEHPTRCRCSTCTLIAELAWMIRDHDQRQQGVGA